MSDRVFVTGCNGFIGSHLTERLLNDGHTVTGLDIVPAAEAHNIQQILDHEGFTYIQGDITNAYQIRELIDASYSKVFHLAAYVGIEKYIETPIDVVRTNVVGTLNVLDACMEHGIYLFFSSTSEVYGRNPKVPWAEDDDRVLGPTTIERWSYSSSKGAAEQAVMGAYKQGLVNGCTVRFFNIYGPRQNPIFLVSRNIERAAVGEDLMMHNTGEQTRCFTYVDDAVDACVRIAYNTDLNAEVFNIGSDVEHTIKEVLLQIVDISEKEVKIAPIDTDVLYPNSFEDIIRRVPNVNKVKALVGWRATTTLAEGLQKTYEWAKEKHLLPH